MKMRKITWIGMFWMVLLVAAVNAQSAALVDGDGEAVSLDYVTLSESYIDDGSNNPSVWLRLYDVEEDVYVGVVYSDSVLENYVLITPNINGRLSKVGYPNYVFGNGYIDTNLDFSTSYAVYPGIVYVVVSEDDGISSDDNLIRLDPGDGWLMGVDGGLPCLGVGGMWVVEGNDMCSDVECDCNEADADQDYDSFDIAAVVGGNDVEVTVLAAYYRNVQDFAVEIPVESDLVVELRDKSGNYLDSALVGIREEVVLDNKGLDADVYVNGIKTGEVSAAVGSVEKDGSSGGISKPSSDGKMLWDFEISDVEGLSNVVVLLDRRVEYLDLTAQNVEVPGFDTGFEIMTADIVESAKLRFYISRGWLTENLLSEKGNHLYIKDGDKWKVVDADVVDEDEELVYYLSEDLDSLGMFALGLMPEKPDEIDKPVELRPVIEDNAPELEEPSSPINLALVFMVALVLILVVAFLVVMKRVVRE